MIMVFWILQPSIDFFQELECLLPARADSPVIAADAEEVDLTDFDRSQGSGGGARREAYNDSSDEEGGHHGPGVQCAHQQKDSYIKTCLDIKAYLHAHPMSPTANTIQDMTHIDAHFSSFMILM